MAGPSGATSRLALPYPTPTDTVDVPRDVQALADRLDDLDALPYVEVVVTSLPASPVDGQVINFLASSAAGVVWRLRYRAASASGWKWEFVGGPPLTARSDAVLRPGASTTYATLTGAPSITLPAGLDGDYDISVLGDIGNQSAGAYSTFLSYTVGATAANDAWAAQTVWSNNQQSCIKTYRHTSIAAGAVIAERARVSGAQTANFSNRSLWVTPVRVG